MSHVVLRMSLAHSSTLGVAARAVADTGGSLGLSGIERTQLEALMSEALTAVIADSFAGAEEIDVDVTISHEPGGIDVVFQQHGAPSRYVSGSLPVRLETLLSLGYADSMQFVSDGVRGSELRISRAVSTGALLDNETFVSDTESADFDSELIDDTSIEMRRITADDAIEVARLYFRTYGYTKIGSPWIYEPEVFRHKVDGGFHDGCVAVLPSGRVVGHVGVMRPHPQSLSASGGPLAVDPALRRRGIAGRLAAAFLPHLSELRLKGLYSEAVTAHPASQKAALNTGAQEVGLVLGRQPADLDFLGFDGPAGFRRAVMVLYTPLDPGGQEQVHVPARYRAIVERVYQMSGLPRTVASDAARPPEGLPGESSFTTELLAATKYAQINVVEYGADFVEALQGLMLRFEREQFEVITVHLPLMNPLTGYFGAGLGELGLSFNAVFPAQELGDQLVLGVSFTEQDPATIAVASDFGKELLDYVIADRGRVISAKQSRARSRTSIARILDSL